MTGNNKATPRLAVKPGNIPINKPIETPKNMAERLVKENKSNRISILSILISKTLFLTMKLSIQTQKLQK